MLGKIEGGRRRGRQRVRRQGLRAVPGYAATTSQASLDEAGAISQEQCHRGEWQGEELAAAGGWAQQPSDRAWGPTDHTCYRQFLTPRRIWLGLPFRRGFGQPRGATPLPRNRLS